MSGLNSELVKMARARIAEMTPKQAFVPIDPKAAQAAPGMMPPGGAPMPPGGAPMPPPGAPPMPPPGAPPMDPMAGGGMPPPAPPMDPMAGGGMPPPDPSMGGAPPPMPGGDPAAGMPPGGEPQGQPIIVGLDDLLQLFMEVAGSTGAGPQEGGGEAGNEPEKPKGTKANKDAKLDQILEQQAGIMQALGLPGAAPAPGGEAGADPNALAPIGQGMSMPEGAMPTPEIPPAPEGMAPPGAMPPGGGMTVAASEQAKQAQVPPQTNRITNNGASQTNALTRVMRNLKGGSRQ